MIVTDMLLYDDDNIYYFFVSVSKIQIINSGQIKGRELVYEVKASQFGCCKNLPPHKFFFLSAKIA